MLVDSIILDTIKDLNFSYTSQFFQLWNLSQLSLKPQAKNCLTKIVLYFLSFFQIATFRQNYPHSLTNLPKATRNCEHMPAFYNFPTICRDIVVLAGTWPGNSVNMQQTNQLHKEVLRNCEVPISQSSTSSSQVISCFRICCLQGPQNGILF